MAKRTISVLALAIASPKSLSTASQKRLKQGAEAGAGRRRASAVRLLPIGQLALGARAAGAVHRRKRDQLPDQERLP